MKVYNRDLYVALSNVHILKKLQGGIFAIKLYKAIDKARFEVQALESIREKSDDYLKYENEVSNLDNKYKSDKDIDLTNSAKYKNEKEAINKKYEKVIAEQLKKDEEFNKVVNSESDFKKVKIAEKFIPENISVEQYEIAQLLLDIM